MKSKKFILLVPILAVFSSIIGIVIKINKLSHKVKEK